MNRKTCWLAMSVVVGAVLLVNSGSENAARALPPPPELVPVVLDEHDPQKQHERILALEEQVMALSSNQEKLATYVAELHELLLELSKDPNARPITEAAEVKRNTKLNYGAEQRRVIELKRTIDKMKKMRVDYTRELKRNPGRN